jgi:hypothetical protein
MKEMKSRLKKSDDIGIGSICRYIQTISRSLAQIRKIGDLCIILYQQMKPTRGLNNHDFENICQIQIPQMQISEKSYNRQGIERI